MLCSVCFTLLSPDVYGQSSAEGKLGKWKIEKILVLGNSITLHAPAPDIGWHGNWGMAASAEEKDFVHRLAGRIEAATMRKPELRVRNIADFERNYRSFVFEPWMDDDLHFQADLVVLAIGENVAEPANEGDKKAFEKSVETLLRKLHENTPRPQAVFVRSSFWASPSKDEVLRRAAESTSSTFVDISSLGAKPENAASAERHFDHAGVAAHPGDAGMDAIAEALMRAIREEAGK